MSTTVTPAQAHEPAHYTQNHGNHRYAHDSGADYCIVHGTVVYPDERCLEETPIVPASQLPPLKIERIYAGSPHPAGSLHIQITAGPCCESGQEVREDMCGHGSCDRIANERGHGPFDAEGNYWDDGTEDLFFCPVHWEWAALDEANSFSGTGFAGGSISHITYTCGCRYDDESDDVAAAM